MFHAILTSFLLLAQGDALRGQLAAIAAFPSEDSTTEQTAEDVEIMRRLLVRAVDEAAPDEALTTETRVLGSGVIVGEPLAPLTSFFSTPSTGVVTHARGFHAPGVGAIFVLDARVPVVAVEPHAEREQDGQRADDDWERVRREVRTGKTEGKQGVLQMFRGVPTKWELDPDAIEAIERAVLETLARHGERIGLDDGEDITVALHLQQSSSFRSLGYTFSVDGDDGDDGDEDGTGWTTLAGKVAPAQRMIVRVRVGDVVRAGTDARELRERASVFRY